MLDYKKLRSNLRKKLLNYSWLNFFGARILWLYIKFVYRTNSLILGSDNPVNLHKKYNPFIITFWHGQHLMGPMLRPKNEQIVAMFSRSKDAELNAMLGEMLGLGVIRGSGGRGAVSSRDKGGVRALLNLCNCLRKGSSVSMIANVSKTPIREVGRGLIILAKISGRPIIPYIYSFSLRIILERSWDKMAIPLPFGKSVFLAGEPFFIPADISDEQIEQKRLELTKIMDDLTQKAQIMLVK